MRPWCSGSVERYGLGEHGVGHGESGLPVAGRRGRLPSRLQIPAESAADALRRDRGGGAIHGLEIVFDQRRLVAVVSEIVQAGRAGVPIRNAVRWAFRECSDRRSRGRA